jgi:transposase InsO family protein
MFVADITYLPKYIVDKFPDCVYLLNIVDHFSKYAWSFFLKNKDSSSIEYCLKILFSHHKPKIFLTDNGLEFDNESLKCLLKENGIKPIHVRVKHPQTQGSVEKLNRAIKEAFLLIIHQNQKLLQDPHAILSQMIYEYNRRKHRTTQLEPIEALHLKENIDIEKINNIKERMKKLIPEVIPKMEPGTRVILSNNGNNLLNEEEGNQLIINKK